VHVRLVASQEGICCTKFVKKKRSTNPISIVCLVADLLLLLEKAPLHSSFSKENQSTPWTYLKQEKERV
jgi:hypothetical protein